MYEISYQTQGHVTSQSGLCAGSADLQSDNGIYNPFSTMNYLKDENGDDYYTTPIETDSQIVLIPQQESYQLQYPKIS